MPLGELRGIRAGAPVESTAPRDDGAGRCTTCSAACSTASAHPIDGGPSLLHLPRVTGRPPPPHPLTRNRITEALPLGVRALDTLVPCGRGQRIGIFAGSGVGKSTLLSMITRGTEAPSR